MSTPTLSIAGTTVVEGDSGATKAVFTVTLSAASVTPVTVDVATANGTALGGTDFTAGTGTLTISAGSLSANILVDVTGDTRYEAAETFSVTLSNPTGATFADGAANVSATGTILNDDSLPVLSVQNVSVKEGDSGTSVATFTVALSAPSDLPVTFRAGTRGITASPGVDYGAGTADITIPAGQTSYQINVTLNGDSRFETDEQFELVLVQPTNATFADGATSTAGTATIVNDDTAPTQQALVLGVDGTPVVIELRTDLAPGHVARIVELAQSGFYDNSPFHRVVEDFVAQGGKSAGTGGGSGELLAPEFTTAPFLRGAVGMARATSVNSADSQFFVMLADNQGLDGNYTVWGQVVNGMEAIDALPRGEPPATPGTMTYARVGDTLKQGNAGAEAVQGGTGRDVLMGAGGNDTLSGGVGNDTLLGGSGTDVAVFSGNRSAYTITIGSGAKTYSVAGPDGTDTLVSVETLRFADGDAWIEDAAGQTGVVHRFYNSATGAHFFTTSNTEANAVRATLPTFDHEGLAYRTAADGAAGATDVFRFYNTALGYHFYTANAAERDAIMATLPNFQYEGVAYKAYAADNGPQEELYRFFNTSTGAHFFTTSETERDAIIATLPAFTYEGVAFYVDVL